MSVMRRPRMIVAYREVRPLMVGPGGWTERRWCGACASAITQDEWFRLIPIYRSGDLSGRCAECAIELRDLASAGHRRPA